MLELVLKVYSLAIVLLQCAKGYAEEVDLNEIPPGRYVPELHGAARGKYIQDDSGQYHHIHVPYDGGYGDRGLKYEHDERGVFRRPFALGPFDHLHFMIDFNYNGSGWQIIQFEWLRDGAMEKHYSYVNQNKLWEENGDGGRGYVGPTQDDTPQRRTNVHVEGASTADNGAQIDEDNLNVSYSDDNDQKEPDPDDIRDTIRDVLYYIENNIIPTLN